jgi:glutamate/aspartate transport system permease protein
MFLWFFVLPEVLPDAAGHFLKRDLPYPEFTIAAVCLGCYTASRVAEIVRAGILSAGAGQRIAALASGMSTIQAYRYVLLPLAFRLMVPPLVSEFLSIFKNSSVALAIGVFELTNQANQIENYTFQGFEAYTAATALYATISFVCLRGARRLSRHGSVGGMIAAGSAP